MRQRDKLALRAFNLRRVFRQVRVCLRKLKQAGPEYDPHADPAGLLTARGFGSVAELRARAVLYANRGPGGAPRICQFWSEVFPGDSLELMETAETAMIKAERAEAQAAKLKRRAARMENLAEKHGNTALVLACEGAPMLSEADLSLIEDYDQIFQGADPSTVSLPTVAHSDSDLGRTQGSGQAPPNSGLLNRNLTRQALHALRALMEGASGDKAAFVLARLQDSATHWANKGAPAIQRLSHELFAEMNPEEGSEEAGGGSEEAGAAATEGGPDEGADLSQTTSPLLGGGQADGMVLALARQYFNLADVNRNGT